MLEDARDFVMLTQIIVGLVELVDERYRTGPHSDQALADDRAYFAQQLSLAEKIAQDLPFPSVLAQIRRLTDLMRDEGHGASVLWAWIKELGNRLEDDAETIKFLRVRTDLFKYYEEAQLFGEEVSNRFAAAIDDIADAGKCLALGQGTATVFHLMRVMEVGLKALAAPLGIPYAPSWESYLRQINAQMAVKHEQKSAEWKRDEAFYRDVAGDLQTVKIAWRNPTMHIVKKYTVEEAEEIFRAVRSLMKRLANHQA